MRRTWTVSFHAHMAVSGLEERAVCCVVGCQELEDEQNSHEAVGLVGDRSFVPRISDRGSSAAINLEVNVHRVQGAFAMEDEREYGMFVEVIILTTGIPSSLLALQESSPVKAKSYISRSTASSPYSEAISDRDSSSSSTLTFLVFT